MSDPALTLDRILELSPAVTFAGTLVEGRLRTTFVTPNVRTLSGYEAERYTADPDFWIEHVHPADRGRIEIQLTELAPEGPTETLEYRFRGAGGEELWLCDAVRVERLDPATLLLIGSRTRVGAQHVTDTVGRAAEGELASLLAAVPHGVQENDVDGRITYSNAAHHRILGYPDGVLIGKRVFDVQPCVASAEELRGYLAYLVAEQPEPTPYLTRSVRRDGSAVDLQIDWTYKRDHDGRLLGFISVITDVTDRKRAEDQLRQAAVVFENTAEGVIITDADERIIAVNAAFGSLTGYSAAEVLGQESEFLRCGRRSLALHERVVAALREQGHWQGEVWYRRKSGELFPAWQTVSVVQDDDGKISRHVAVFSDISPIKRSQEQLDHLAHHDPLTDLPNRLLFNDRLAHAISRARRDDGQLAVVFIDIDRFKTINDSLGHPSGDEVLQQVARRLVASVRESDTVSRLGGDEFIILLEDLLDVDDVLVLATKLMQAFQEPFKVEGHSLHLNISMGISLFPRDGEEAAMLIKNADAAMYSVKDSGRNDFQFYTRELTHSVFERFTMENALRRAIDREELRLHFQAQLHLETGAVLGAEALLRWEHPELGLVPPAKFVPLAEDTGLIIPIGEWVLRTACRQLHEWRTQGIVLPRIAVNIAGPLISKGALIQAVDQALSESGLAADSLELEITESYIMHGTELSVASLQRMHDLGVGITIDDFGTGYSSLSYLKRLPVGALKIDRSFVGDIPGDPNDEAIVAAVIDLGRSLQLRVIAEGIETDAQRRFLMQRGCAIGQGFSLARPLDAEEFGLWLSEAVAFAVGSSGEGAG